MIYGLAPGTLFGQGLQEPLFWTQAGEQRNRLAMVLLYRHARPTMNRSL